MSTPTAPIDDAHDTVPSNDRKTLEIQALRNYLSYDLAERQGDKSRMDREEATTLVNASLAATKALMDGIETSEPEIFSHVFHWACEVKVHGETIEVPVGFMHDRELTFDRIRAHLHGIVETSMKASDPPFPWDGCPVPGFEQTVARIEDLLRSCPICDEMIYLEDAVVGNEPGIRFLFNVRLGMKQFPRLTVEVPWGER